MGLEVLFPVSHSTVSTRTRLHFRGRMEIEVGRWAVGVQNFEVYDVAYICSDGNGTVLAIQGYPTRDVIAGGFILLRNDTHLAEWDQFVKIRNVSDLNTFFKILIEQNNGK